MKQKYRLAVISPFLDKRHGTERSVVEWLNGIPEHFEVHVYSQGVEDLDLSRIQWHRIPKLPGPHLLGYVWWFAANHLWRAWDRAVRGLRYDLTYSPGVNCLNADVISVHIMFAELLRKNTASMRLRDHPLSDWPRLLHRKIYYHLIAKLERHLYRKPDVALLVIAQRISDGLQEFYGRADPSPVVYFGLDHGVFNPVRRLELRTAAREELHVKANEFALLLIGNDWLNKGLSTLLDAMDRLKELPLHLLVVGTDDRTPYIKAIQEKSLMKRVDLGPPRKDVEFYYAAADVYTGPSKEDALPLPPAEAMACGLPVIVTAKCGVSEIITNGQDGLIMQDAVNAEDLAAKIRSLYEDTSLRQGLGEKAAETARRFTWERSAREFDEVLCEVLRKKLTSGGVQRAGA
ncbi:MAG TPA: glycosyltransferase family 4 protein [Candidatus Acidoferrales bacterium]|nr:glycosyltransferase family 4 protein [Candidatus Acidoferrales bacterium]